MSGSDQDDPQMTLDCLSATVLGQIKQDGNPVTAEEILGTTQRLHSQLGEQRTKIQSGTIAVDKTLYDDPFSLLAAISRHPSRYTGQMRDWIFELSSYKEVIVILEEELTEFKITEAEEMNEDWISEDGEEERSDRKVDEVLQTFKMYIKNYRSALWRVEGTDKFYIAAYQSLSSVLAHLVAKGDFSQPDKRRSTPSPELEVVASLLNLAYDIEIKRDSQDHEDESRRYARLLVEHVFGHLGALLSIGKADNYFYEINPRYKLRKSTDSDSDSTHYQQKFDILKTFVWKGFYGLSYSFANLLDTCRTSGCLLRGVGSFSMISNFACFVYFTQTSGGDDHISDPEVQRGLLSFVLDTIRASLDPRCRYKIAEDDILFYLWWCVAQPKTEEGVKEGYDAAILYSLIPILSSLSAFSPNPQTRFLSFQLLTTVVLSHTGISRTSDMMQLALLKDLVAEDGTPSFKTACIGIVKEVLRGKFEKADQDPKFESIFLSDQCIEELGPSLLRFDPPTLLDNKELKAEEFVEEKSRDVMQKLNWYYFMLQRDVKNKTGIRSPSSVQSTDATFIRPLRSTLSKWLDSSTSSTPLDPSLQLELELLQTTLTRIDEVLKTL